jgi:superkiller protein 3
MALFDWFSPARHGSYDRGIAAFDETRFEDAISSFEECLSEGCDPGTARLAGFYISECYAHLGHSALKMGSFDRALYHIERALARHPNYADLHYSRAFILRKLGSDGADDAIGSALSINPRFARAVLLQGILWIERGDVPNGIERVEEALRIDVGLDAEAITSGLALVSSGQIREGTAILEDVHNEPVEEALEYARSGDVAARKGRYDQAAACFLKALAIKPKFADIRCKYGLALFGLGRPDEATAEFEKALECNPAYAEAKYHLARALIASNHRPRARTVLSELIEVKPDYPGAAELLKLVGD